jgi:hypothetical protein
MRPATASFYLLMQQVVSPELFFIIPLQNRNAKAFGLGAMIEQDTPKTKGKRGHIFLMGISCPLDVRLLPQKLGA